MTESPLILMSVRTRPLDAGRRDPTPFEFEWLPSNFAVAVVRAGGTPVYLSNETKLENVDRLAGCCDGLLLTGGEDVEPWRFKAEDTVGNLKLNPKRDAVEFAAINAADRRGLPILGVCRGAQVLNVARGGTLYQDLPQEYPVPVRDHSRGKPGLTVQAHEVSIASGCRLQKLLGAERISGATSHHQAIRDVGRGLVAVAHSPEDNVIEAVEETGDRFVVGVQWHPEVNNDDSASLNLFKSFIDACATHAATRVAMA